MLFALIVAMMAVVQGVSGLALTFVLGAQENACFYVFTKQPLTLITYYFAVQSGGAFDVDYTIKSPSGEILHRDEKQRQGDFTFNAELPGEYEFCFANGMSTFAEKVVDFEIKLEADDDFKASMPDQPNAKPIAHVESMQATVDKIDEQLDGLMRTLQYYKTRNNRNHATVKSTESRIYYFSIFEVLLMVGMAFLQIYIVQLFFKGSRKQLV